MARRVKGFTVLPDGRLRAHVKVNRSAQGGKARQAVKVFPADTDPEDIRLWRAQQRRELLKTKVLVGTLAQDVERYLKMRSSMRSFEDRKREIGMWLPVFGQRARATITSQEVTEQINTWLATGEHSPTTISHWRGALSNFFKTLNGRSGFNPCRDAIRPPTVAAIDRAIPMSDARAIVQQMVVNGNTKGRRKGSASAVRATILLNTGMRAGELKRLTPADVHVDEDGYVAVPASKGGYPRRVPLNAAARAAFTNLGGLGAYGDYSTASLRKSLLVA